MNSDDDAPLPPMSDALLDDGQLDALVRDLSALATIDEIILKRGPGRVDESDTDARIELADIADLLRRGAVRGVQLRYRHDGARWWDTLMVVPPGAAAPGGRVRLVRIRHG